MPRDIVALASDVIAMGKIQSIKMDADPIVFPCKKECVREKVQTEENTAVGNFRPIKQYLTTMNISTKESKYVRMPAPVATAAKSVLPREYTGIKMYFKSFENEKISLYRDGLDIFLCEGQIRTQTKSTDLVSSPGRRVARTRHRGLRGHVLRGRLLRRLLLQGRWRVLLLRRRSGRNMMQRNHILSNFCLPHRQAPRFSGRRTVTMSLISLKIISEPNRLERSH
jgi:hypothetical protein